MFSLLLSSQLAFADDVLVLPFQVEGMTNISVDTTSRKQSHGSIESQSYCTCFPKQNDSGIWTSKFLCRGQMPT